MVKARKTLPEAVLKAAAAGLQPITSRGGVEASNAAQALELLKNPEEDIDVLFTDVRMPGSMDGLELASVAKRKHPQLHVIVTSGYFDRAELPQGTTFISKPWSPVDLVYRILRAAA